MQNNGNNGGCGFVSLLTVLFIGLKLTNYIDWSWLWVLSPMWITLIIATIVALCMSTTITIRDRRK